MDYEFKRITTDDKSLNEIRSLMSYVFPNANKYSLPFLQWQYRDNPNGKIVGYNAIFNNEVVAHYALMPIVVMMNGNEEKGLLSLNTATHPDHQGKKLFTQLADKSYQLAKEMGYGFVIGVANANSTHGFVNKLGFQLLGMLDAKIGYGKIGYSNQYIENNFQFIWKGESEKWRLLNPDSHYQIKNKTIYSKTDKPFIKAILKNTELRNNNCSIGFRPIKIWIGWDAAIDWAKSNYMDIPIKFRPSPLNLIFKDLSNKNRKLNWTNFKFNAFDFDAF